MEAYIERIAHVNNLINAIARTNYDEARQAARIVDQLVARVAHQPAEQLKADNSVLFSKKQLF